MLDFDVDFLDDLHDAWDECPPVRRMVAAFCGYKPKDNRRGKVEELLSMFAGTGGVIRNG